LNTLTCFVRSERGRDTGASLRSKGCLQGGRSLER